MNNTLLYISVLKPATCSCHMQLVPCMDYCLLHIKLTSKYRYIANSLYYNYHNNNSCRVPPESYIGHEPVQL